MRGMDDTKGVNEKAMEWSGVGSGDTDRQRCR